MLPIIASIVSGLISNGLPKVADAVIEKGVDYVQEKLGVELKPEGQAKPEDYAALKERAMQHEEFRMEQAVKLATADMQNVTDRWKADMSGDSWLSKNIRPLTLIAILGAYFVFASASAFGISVNESYVRLLGEWGQLIMLAYFGGRTVEKVVDAKSKKSEQSK